MANLFDRAGMSTATSGTATLTLGAALGAVPPNLAGFLSFASAGVADQNVVSYLILDVNGGWETGWGVYSAGGTTLTRNVTRSSNANGAISLSGNAQVFITARAEDLATVEALAAANIVINGGMEVSQDAGTNAQAVTSAAVRYIVDIWEAYYQTTGTLALQCQQVADSPIAGISKCAQIKATAGQVSLGANDMSGQIISPIEGNRIAKLGWGTSGAQALTVGFWVKATIAGTLAFAIGNSGGSPRYYVTTVTINNANTWEWKTLTIPGDAVGPWGTDNNPQLYLRFASATGTTFQGAANAWTSSLIVSTSSTTNFMATANNILQVTGVVALPGAHQLSPEQSANLQRSFEEQLALCQRYYEKSYNYSDLPGAVTLNGSLIDATVGLASATYGRSWNIVFNTRKRVAPVITAYSTATGASGKARDGNSNTDVAATVNLVGERQALMNVTNSAAATGWNFTVHWIADARMP